MGYLCSFPLAWTVYDTCTIDTRGPVRLYMPIRLVTRSNTRVKAMYNAHAPPCASVNMIPGSSLLREPLLMKLLYPGE
jgi:hypothetical protein